MKLIDIKIIYSHTHRDYAYQGFHRAPNLEISYFAPVDCPKNSLLLDSKHDSISRTVQANDLQTAYAKIIWIHRLSSMPECRYPALTICRLYKMRWQVELFFKGSSSICESSASMETRSTQSKRRFGSRRAFTYWLRS